MDFGRGFGKDAMDALLASGQLVRAPTQPWAINVDCAKDLIKCVVVAALVYRVGSDVIECVFSRAYNK